ncbi:metallophosphoesterase [Candidatus Woesearchaeota archaeon]|nr:metallophosphoesterase [Candidatus Woesearchaeota archaeon]
MKILAAGCIHNDIDLVKDLAKQAEAEDVDLVVLCGDLTLGESSTDYLVGPFMKKNRKVMLLPGNHETSATVDFLARKYNAINLHGYSYLFRDVGFFGCGGANCGVFQLGEDEIFKTLSKAHEKVKYAGKKIMVTHVHPAETMMEMFSDFVRGSSGVTEAIEKLKPDLLICSHLHEASGIEEVVGKTKVINVSRKGKIIEI